MDLNQFLQSKPDIKNYVEQNECNFGAMTPIPNRFLKTLPDNEVVIPEDIFKQLVDIADKTNQTGCEHTFFLCCPNENVEGNKCAISTFFAHNSNINRRVAEFDDTMTKFIVGLADKVRNGKLKEGAVVFIGHTHPAEDKWYDNFSFGDLDGYSQGIQGNDIYENRKIETGGCMLTADGKIRMVFYDPNARDFYKFTNIRVKTKDEQLVDFEEHFKNYKNYAITPSNIQRLSENVIRNNPGGLSNRVNQVKTSFERLWEKYAGEKDK